MNHSANPPKVRSTENTPEAIGARRAATSSLAASVLPRMCAPAEMMDMMGVGRTTLHDMLAKPGAPKPAIRRARLVRYFVADVLAWIASMSDGQAAANDGAQQ